MVFSGKLVQVTRPTTENSLADGAVGVAWAVAGLLFSEGELEPLP